MEKRILLEVKLVKSSEDLADGPSRWSQDMGGLHPKQRIVSAHFAGNETLCKSTGGYFCIPRQSSIAKFYLKIPPQGGNSNRCIKMPPGQFSGLLCQSSLENYKQVAKQIKGKQAFDMLNNNPILGFKCMVAPTNENAKKGVSSTLNTPISWDVQKLLGRINASTPLAPSLHSIIRKGMESKQIPPKTVDTYLKSLTSIARYDRAFKLFWAFAKEKDISATEATLDQVAGLLLDFDKLMPSQARHAYASLILIPGLGQLAFNPLLRQVKKQWNTSSPRYASFYNAQNPVQSLARQPLNWNDISQVREILILSCRFLMLCRSVDLARMHRIFSMVDGQPFILFQRKGWKTSQWEAMLSIPDQKAICPWQLLKHYVARGLWFSGP